MDYLYDTIIASKESRPGSLALLKQILEELVICRSSLFIAIDGLDECEQHERSEILSVVSNVSKKCDTEENVKFFLSSRREEDIKLSLQAAFFLSIEPKYVESDIRAYVKLQAAKLSKKFDFDAAKEREIVREVMTRPEGKFGIFSILCGPFYSSLSTDICRDVSACPVDYGKFARSRYNS